MAADAINIKEVRTIDGRGTRHRQIFMWTDSNARAMQDVILEQQQWHPSLRIRTSQLLGLLDAVRMSAPETERKLSQGSER